MVTIDLRMYRMSGIGRYLRNVIPALLPQLHADRIQILAAREELQGDSCFLDSRIEIVEADVPIYSLREMAMGLHPALRHTDLLWVPHYNAPMSYRGRLVVTIHDVCHLALPQSLDSPFKRAYSRMLFENVARRAEAVFCVSKFTASEIDRYLSIPKERVHLTRLGIDPGWGSEVAAGETMLSAPYFLFVGNVKPNKNLSTLLSAFRRVIRHIPHNLIIVGSVDGLNTLDRGVIKLAEEYPERIRFTGKVSDQALKQYYRGAEAFIFPSLYEGFGLPVLEAMSLDCPVIASGATSLPEVAGDAAIFCDPHRAESFAEAILSIASDKSLRRDLIRRGRERVSSMTYDACIKTTAAVLNQLS